jgi:sulfate/thiosulfate transport system substrate-binding protein
MRARRSFCLAIATALLLVACGSDKKSDTTSSSGGATGQKLALVAYSTPQTAYEGIIKAFQKTPEGKGATFTQSYGASGDQSRAVEAGLKADYVGFSLEPDVTRLVKADLVTKDWAANEHKGIVTKSVVVFAVRKGNPKNIKTWDDLIKPGVEVINANPFTSGGARWNVMAAYGQAAADGGEQAGIAYLSKLFKNIPVQDDSARKALQTFSSGKGDVLLSYENEAIFAQQKGEDLEYIVPDSTILIENPAAVTIGSPKQAKAFLDYVWTKPAQTIFAKNGYRPVVEGIDSPYDFPEPSGLFTIQEFGGWPTVMKKFFDPEKSIVATIETANGVTIAKK